MAGPVYIADPVDLVLKVELEGLTAFYHRPSGMTHVLAPPAPQILDALCEQAADVQQLSVRLSRNFEIDGSEDALSARLSELEAAGLVRRA